MSKRPRKFLLQALYLLSPGRRGHKGRQPMSACGPTVESISFRRDHRRQLTRQSFRWQASLRCRRRSPLSGYSVLYFGAHFLRERSNDRALQEEGSMTRSIFFIAVAFGLVVASPPNARAALCFQYTKSGGGICVAQVDIPAPNKCITLMPREMPVSRLRHVTSVTFSW